MKGQRRGAKGEVVLSRGPDGGLDRWHVALHEDGTLLVSRAAGPLAEPRVVARVASREARIEDGLWESQLHAAGITLPLSAGERAAVARLLALRDGPAAALDRDLEWRHLHLDALRSGKSPRPRISPPTSHGRLTLEHWGLLAPPDRHPILDRIGEQIWPAILSLRVTGDREAGLSRTHEVDPASSRLPAARAFGHAARALGLPSPRLFVRTDVAGGIAHMPVWPLASLCGNALLDFAERELLFLWGVHLAAYRPESYLSTLLLDPLSVATALHAALRIANAVEAADAAVEQTAQQLAQKMMPAQVYALTKISALLSIELPPVELREVLVAAAERWLLAVTKTRLRAGLLLCDELATALRLLVPLGPVWDIEALREDLERFWISEELSTLRSALGR